MMENKETYELKSIELELQTYGADEGKYTGKVRFQNGHYESFEFRIRPKMAERYVELIAEDLVKGADRLAGDLIKSLGLKRSKAHA